MQGVFKLLNKAIYKNCAKLEKYVSELYFYKVLSTNNLRLFTSISAMFDSNNNKIFKGTFTAEEEEIKSFISS